MKDKKNTYFFETFINARNIKNISIDNVHEKTKISKKHIRAIETGKFNEIPSAYIKLLLKSYANFLKIDKKEILKQYEEYLINKYSFSNNKSTPTFIKNKESVIYSNKDDSIYHNQYFIHKNKIFGTIAIIFIIIFTISSLSILYPTNIPDDWYMEEYQLPNKIEHNVLVDSLNSEKIKITFKFKDSENKFFCDKKETEILNKKNSIFSKTINAEDNYECLLYNNDVNIDINNERISMPDNNGIIKLEYISGNISIYY